MREKIEGGGWRIVRAAAIFMLVFLFATICNAQEKFRFPIAESSKTLSYGPLWVASKMGFFERKAWTCRSSPCAARRWRFRR